MFQKKIKYLTIGYGIAYLFLLFGLGFLCTNIFLGDQAKHIFTLIGMILYLMGLTAYPIGFFGLVISFKEYNQTRDHLGWMLLYSFSFSILICLIIVFIFLSKL